MGVRSTQEDLRAEFYEYYRQEDPRTEFYKHYRKEVEEYDKEFIKRHDEDLNITLIFVRWRDMEWTHADAIGRPVCSLQ